MERICFFIELVAGAEDEYDRRHREIWPEMSAAVAAGGQTNYTLFRRGTTVVGYAECIPDVATARAKISASDVAIRWHKSFDGIIQRMTDRDGNLLRAQEILHL